MAISGRESGGKLGSWMSAKRRIAESDGSGLRGAWRDDGSKALFLAKQV
jgi:hypothetical protein